MRSGPWEVKGYAGKRWRWLCYDSGYEGEWVTIQQLCAVSFFAAMQSFVKACVLCNLALFDRTENAILSSRDIGDVSILLLRSELMLVADQDAWMGSRKNTYIDFLLLWDEKRLRPGTAELIRGGAGSWRNSSNIHAHALTNSELWLSQASRIHCRTIVLWAEHDCSAYQ